MQNDDKKFQFLRAVAFDQHTPLPHFRAPDYATTFDAWLGGIKAQDVRLKPIHEAVAKLIGAAEYVVRHKDDTCPHAQVTIMDCATVCEQALANLKKELERL